MSVGLIWAQSANGVIGRDGTLPWHLPEDLAHFKAHTSGSTVVMGRKTWDSLPPKVRPLPGRTNVVVTTQQNWQAPGATVAHSLADALPQSAADVWVIGGAGVYAAALEYAEHVAVTELQERFDGDVHAPTLGPAWHQRSCDPESGWYQSSSGLHYRLLRYTR